MFENQICDRRKVFLTSHFLHFCSSRICVFLRLLDTMKALNVMHTYVPAHLSKSVSIEFLAEGEISLIVKIIISYHIKL